MPELCPPTAAPRVSRIRLAVLLMMGMASRVCAWAPPHSPQRRGASGPVLSMTNPSPFGEDAPNGAGNNHDDADAPSFAPPPQDPGVFGQDYSAQEPMTTLRGGTALMLRMIRQALAERSGGESPPAVGASAASAAAPPSPPSPQPWRPYAGVSDSNTDFRSRAPSMTNEGYARSMWRNLRKRHKPSLWMEALRTYDRMAALEKAQDSSAKRPPSNTTTASSTSTAPVPSAATTNSTAATTARSDKIRRFNVHYEAAMLACAKLGLWQRALEIYHEVFQKEKALAEYRRRKQQEQSPSTVLRSPFAQSQKARLAKQQRKDLRVTDDMVLSLVKACVRASRQRSKHRSHQPNLTPAQEEREAALRRIPLDTALQVLRTMEEHHGIPVTPAFVNPLAKAYQSLGYIPQSRHILRTLLSNRTAGEEPEEGGDIVNVHDFSAKNKASYGLLVEGAVATGDWGAAVEALTEMIDAGLYPSRRHSNLWHEISERQTRPRARGSRKKKRDDAWTALGAD